MGPSFINHLEKLCFSPVKKMLNNKFVSTHLKKLFTEPFSFKVNLNSIQSIVKLKKKYICILLSDSNS